MKVGKSYFIVRLCEEQNGTHKICSNLLRKAKIKLPHFVGLKTAWNSAKCRSFKDGLKIYEIRFISHVDEVVFLQEHNKVV
jgi:hypothetical protein